MSTTETPEEPDTPEEEPEPDEEETTAPTETETEEVPETETESEASSETEFLDIYNDPDLTPDKLNTVLNEYAQAYKEEFELKSQEAPENVEEHTRDFFKRNSAASAAQIVWLSNNADSETVRLNASKTVLTMAFADAKADGDPIKQLLNDLTHPDRKKQKSSI